MNGRQLSLLAGTGSAALLIAALGFQAAGYAPCELCILQRWPHVAAVVVAALIWLTGRVRVLAVLGMMAAGIAMGLAIYHTGVELSLWAGPTQCSGTVGNLASMAPADLMERLQSAPVVRCDEVAWRFLGLSMAAWNAVLSAGLAVVWGIAAKRPSRGSGAA
ncbi:disulfide bond formation protein B [Paracoccus sediminis]|uniref:Disulfide bond formation protein B n=1 Tax=Paracoccus sediminis TaxID=1214787 RepID=A0A238WDG9_9RHOB|nr:disulfide bond formation protein B [Paracoccus sediminis]TBN50977.1 disulfide bond formation protein B [Paracoccus sediminis]SNR43729.1 Disulfide bond formation protein DsbB [Paracoccus sediminis]